MYIFFFLLLQIKIDEEAQEYSDFDFNFNVLILKESFNSLYQLTPILSWRVHEHTIMLILDQNVKIE